MKHLLLGAVAFAAACLPLSASAQFAKPEDAIKYRQSSMFLIAQHFGRVAAMANDKIPFDAAAVKENAAIVAAVSRLPWDGFVKGTDKGATKALPEVWINADKFGAAQKRFTDSVAKLAAAAETGDKAQIRAAVGEAGATCRGCHDDFRGR